MLMLMLKGFREGHMQDRERKECLRPICCGYSVIDIVSGQSVQETMEMTS